MPDSPRLSALFLRLSGLAPIVRCAPLVIALGCGIGDEPQRLRTTKPPPASSGSVVVEARKPLLPAFPCSRCHAGRAPNPKERRLTEFHTQKVLDHGTQSGWCYRCHAKDAIDQLHLADGTLVGFDEGYELCGSCHGDKLREWRAGIHGLTTGFWLGNRTRRSCPACHDPHSPRFPLMTPEHSPAHPRTVPAQAASPSTETPEEPHEQRSE